MPSGFLFASIEEKRADTSKVDPPAQAHTVDDRDDEAGDE
jgi:hypothetical protein